MSAHKEVNTEVSKYEADALTRDIKATETKEGLKLKLKRNKKGWRHTLPPVMLQRDRDGKWEVLKVIPTEI